LSPRPGLRLPDDYAARARDIQEGRVEAAHPRDASTVILLRDGPPGHGLIVYLMQRVSSMKFAPGAFVFPGGSVDPRDADLSVAWAGPSPAQWGAAFGADEALARELVSAAVRETYEESGVLLAGPDETTIVPDTSGDDWEADRQALLDRSSSLAEMLGRRSLVIRGDLMRPWAHWITPIVEPRRYDTRFFVAALPDGQRTREVSTESDLGTWMRPDQAVESARRGDMPMLPPTLVTLSELAEYSSVSAVLGASREITPRLPETQVTDDGVFLVLPEDMSGAVPPEGA
jgi:8-oxo-dGTP pyrophosphatase MutT (NUDIX family)